jgi:predicted nucleic acid-binding protein
MISSEARKYRLFLDPNVLISAAWKDGSKVSRLWQIPGVHLMTSEYCVTESYRNLHTAERADRLSGFLISIQILTFSSPPLLNELSLLPEKDQPVLAAAVLARADFLVTGDRNHFGAWFGQSLCGVRIEPPGSFPEVLL